MYLTLVNSSRIQDIVEYMEEWGTNMVTNDFLQKIILIHYFVIQLFSNKNMAGSILDIDFSI